MSLFRRVTKPLSVEDWAMQNSTLCQADEIISAAVVASIAKDPDDWMQVGSFEKSYHYYSSEAEYCDPAILRNKKKNLEVKFGIRATSSIIFIDKNNFVSMLRLKGTKVNDIEIAPRAAEIIYKSWNTYRVRVRALEAAAEKARTDMERTKKAWDLAEKLLDMKRNEFGALVPVTPDFCTQGCEGVGNCVSVVDCDGIGTCSHSLSN